MLIFYTDTISPRLYVYITHAIRSAKSSKLKSPRKKTHKSNKNSLASSTHPLISHTVNLVATDLIYETSCAAGLATVAPRKAPPAPLYSNLHRKNTRKRVSRIATHYTHTHTQDPRNKAQLQKSSALWLCSAILRFET